MKLVASMMIGPGEQERYVGAALESLLTFCDEVRVRLDGDLDLPVELSAPVQALVAQPSFFRHEGRARQELLDWTLQADPTHILAIDADEFVTDGQAIRHACERGITPAVRSLCMMEVWGADDDGLTLRQDGGWVEHPVPILWSPRAVRGRTLRIADRALACGRIPTALRGVRTVETCAGVLHFGWAQPAERQARYDRYARHDGGRFHAGTHLQSILWPDDRCTLSRMEWPAGLEPWRDQILARAAVHEPAYPATP